MIAKNVQLLIASKGNAYYHEIADLYASAFRDLGFVVEVALDKLPNPSADFTIIVAPHEYFPLYLAPYLKSISSPVDTQIPQICSQAYLLCLESPQSPTFQKAKSFALHAKGVLEMSEEALPHWEALNVKAIHLPLPFLAFSQNSGPDHQARHKDLSFMGRGSPRRMKAFQEKAPDLDHYETALVFFRHSRPMTEAAPGLLFGVKRSQLLHDTKILVNIHLNDRDGFDWYRAMLAISHGCIFATEATSHLGGLIPGTHLITAPYEELIDSSLELLQSPEKAAAMQKEAFEFLVTHYDHKTRWGNIAERLLALRKESEVKPVFSPPNKDAPFTRSFFSRLFSGFAKKDKSQKIVPLLICAESGLEEFNGRLLVTQIPCVFSLRPDLRTFQKSFAKVNVQFETTSPFALHPSITLEATAEQTSYTQEYALDAGTFCTFTVQFTENVTAIRLTLFAEIGAELTNPSATYRELDSQEVSHFLMHHLSSRQDSFESQMKKDLKAAEMQVKRLNDTVKSIQTKLEMMKNQLPSQFQQMAKLERSKQRNQENRALELQDLAQGIPTYKVEHSAGSRAKASIDLSVIIPLYNYEAFIQEAIASVLEASSDLNLELVIVNDASTDQSLEAAKACLKDLPIDARIIDRKYNQGLAEARNLGIRESRGEYVFFLDADNIVLKNGLRRLLIEAKSQNAPASYGILATFHSKEEDHRRSLISYYAWTPADLLLGNYIDAMALFNRKVLQDLKGYDAELGEKGIPGWEDYELWLRFVNEGLTPAFVPQIIGLYRYHGNSMMDNFKLHEIIVKPLLKEKYPKLWKTK